MAFREELIEEVKQKLAEIEQTPSLEKQLALAEDIDKTLEFFAAFREWDYYHRVEALGVVPSPTVLGRILCNVCLEPHSETCVNYNTRVLEGYWRRERPIYPDPLVVHRVYHNVSEKRYVRRWIESHYDLTVFPPRPLPDTSAEIF